jgi:hypothetical protein
VLSGRRLKKFDPKRWLPTLTIAWGVAAALQGVVGSQRGFYAARFCACAPLVCLPPAD